MPGYVRGLSFYQAFTAWDPYCGICVYLSLLPVLSVNPGAQILVSGSAVQCSSLNPRPLYEGRGYL